MFQFARAKSVRKKEGNMTADPPQILDRCRIYFSENLNIYQYSSRVCGNPIHVTKPGVCTSTIDEVRAT